MQLDEGKSIDGKLLKLSKIHNLWRLWQPTFPRTFFFFLSWAKSSGVGTDEANMTAKADECVRPSSWSPLGSLLCEGASLLQPIFIFFAMRKPEVGGGVGEKGGVSPFSSVPESSSPTHEWLALLEDPPSQSSAKHNITARLDASCGCYQLDTSLSSSCIKPACFIKLPQVGGNHTWCNTIFADLLQVVKSTCIKLVDKKSRELHEACWQLTKPHDQHLIINMIIIIIKIICPSKHGWISRFDT